MKRLWILSLVVMSAVVFTAATTGEANKWFTDFTEAKTEASKSNKKILMVFSGSDWCAPCIRLHKTLFEDAAFQDFAKESLVLLEVDFPRKSKNKLSAELQAHNKELAGKYNPRGMFPKVLVVDAKGKVVGQMKYPQSSNADYMNDIKKLIAQ